MRSRTDRRSRFRSRSVEGDDGAVGEASTFAEGGCCCMMHMDECDAHGLGLVGGFLSYFFLFIFFISTRRRIWRGRWGTQVRGKE